MTRSRRCGARVSARCCCATSRCRSAVRCSTSRAAPATRRSRSCGACREGSRLIAIDASSAMLDVARRKVADLGPLGKKGVFFRTESAVPKLSFADDVYDLVVCNLGLSRDAEPRDRAARLRARVQAGRRGPLHAAARGHVRGVPRPLSRGADQARQARGARSARRAHRALPDDRSRRALHEDARSSAAASRSRSSRSCSRARASSSSRR